MNTGRAHGSIVKGVVHCHTSLSYDSQVELASLCNSLRDEGFDFVALTEHSESLSAKDYKEFVSECRRLSSEKFIVIPGLEVCCEDGTEIAGIGIQELVYAASSRDVTARIRELGGYAIWVHPLKHGRWKEQLPDCDAVEILNGKVDGTLAPKLRLLRHFKRSLQKENSFHAIFGLDLHHLNEPRNVWTECEVPALSEGAIVGSLSGGRFVNRVTSGVVTSSADVSSWDYLRFMLLRLAYICWNTCLDILPEKIRMFLIRFSRPLVETIKTAK